MCVDMCADVYEHVNRHLYGHVSTGLAPIRAFQHFNSAEEMTDVSRLLQQINCHNSLETSQHFGFEPARHMPMHAPTRTCRYSRACTCIYLSPVPCELGLQPFEGRTHSLQWALCVQACVRACTWTCVWMSVLARPVSTRTV